MKPAAVLPSPAPSRSWTWVRWILGAIFVVAGALKIAHPADFYADILAYEVALPDGLLRWVALVLPWLEVSCGAAVLADFWVETAAILMAFMCLTFVLLLGQAVLRGLDLRCGCFGSADLGWLDHPVAALGRASLLLWGSLWLCSSAPGPTT